MMGNVYVYCSVAKEACGFWSTLIDIASELCRRQCNLISSKTFLMQCNAVLGHKKSPSKTSFDIIEQGRKETASHSCLFSENKRMVSSKKTMAD